MQDSADQVVQGMRGVRARAREQVLSEIISIAELQLRQRGASELSLRAIARELGMVSSAIYRYFPSADALLTTLIIRAYNDLADAAEAALQAKGGDSSLRRYLAVCHGCRDWALENPQRFALIYGTPIPGYVAPRETIDPATRVARLLMSTIELNRPAPQFSEAADWAAERSQLALKLSEVVGEEVDGDQIAAGVAGWNQLFGLLSFELFGHFVGSVTDNRSYFDAVMLHWGRHLGLD
ncbi:TetR/AcrR family transcriptional regulator [Psychromicrobium sp. YIM B11713]|uniref:TetR/AcrR family transcriptional regulator n=1 Tax=Psychromicrobium sp. YIM B11713 TaxID=3145233 RepID=UPI00374E3EAA